MSKDTANWNLKGWVQNREDFKIHLALDFALLLKGNMKNGFEPDWENDQKDKFLTWCRIRGVR